MPTNFIVKTKLLFSALVILWMVFIIGAVRNSTLDNQVSYVRRQANYLDYKLEYNKDRGDFSLAEVVPLLSSVFKSPEPIATATTTAGEIVGIPVLVYHGIIDEVDRFSLTPDSFKNQMFALKEAGYETIGIEDFHAFLKGEEVKIPEKPFLLTFDDGRRDSYESADPVLQALGWKAVMFVATEQSFGEDENNYYLKESQAKNMLESGRWEIQSHAVQTLGGFIPVNENNDKGNLLSSRMWLPDEKRIETEEEFRARVEKELVSSKETLERLFGKKVSAFAYPFGDYGNQTINAEGIAEDAVRDSVSRNYEVAFRQTWPEDNYFTFNYMDEDLYRLKRVEVSPLWSGEELVAFLNRSEPKSLPYSDSLTTDQGWKNERGTLSFDENGLHLKVDDGRTGSFTFLDGTRFWRDYLYTVKTIQSPESYLTLYARYQSSDNYVSCTFGENLVRIDERVESSSRVMNELDDALNPLPNTTYAIRVRDNEVSCYERGILVASASGINGKLSSGGIGFRIWKEAAGEGALTITELEVEPENQMTITGFSLPSFR